jgi:hypothetical protein
MLENTRLNETQTQALCVQMLLDFNMSDLGSEQGLQEFRCVREGGREREIEKLDQEEQDNQTRLNPIPYNLNPQPETINPKP